MAFSSDSPFLVNSSAPAPFSGPSAALRAQWYPDITSSFVPQLFVLSGLFGAYFLVNLANVVVRLRRTPVHLLSTRNRMLVWSTSSVHCLFLLLFLASAQGQIWILARIFRSGGSYTGLALARGLSWSALLLAAAFHALGVGAATGFSTSATDAAGCPRPALRLMWNFASVAFPLVFGGISLGPAIAAEVFCGNQFAAFRAAEAIAQQGDAAAAAGEDTTPYVLQWGMKLLQIQDSMCVEVQQISYGGLLAALVIIFVATSTFYVLLSRKLRAQALLLRRSVERYRTVELAGLSSQHTTPSPIAREWIRDGSVTPDRTGHGTAPSVSTIYSESTHKSQLSRSFSDVSFKSSKLGLPSKRSSTPVGMRAVREDVRLEARADALEAGLCNLRWQTSVLLVAAAMYITNAAIILIKGEATQNDPFWAALVNLWGLWIYGAVAGPCSLTMLLISVSDPSRQSLLGIPFYHTFRAPICPSSEDDDEDLASLEYGRLSHALPYREEMARPRTHQPTMAALQEVHEYEEPKAPQPSILVPGVYRHQQTGLP